MNTKFLGAATDTPAGRGFFINGKAAGVFQINGQAHPAIVQGWIKVRQTTPDGALLNHATVVVGSPSREVSGLATFAKGEWSFSPVSLEEGLQFIQREREAHTAAGDSVIPVPAQKYTDECRVGR